MNKTVPTFDELAASADALAVRLLARGWTMASAESCTGGLIGAVCTSLAGSSRWYERGYITYSNEAKTECLGVPPELIASCGAVSEEVAAAMAVGALERSHAQVAVAVTGIAGPTGATPGKPVGTVWLAVAATAQGDQPRSVTTRLETLPGDRSAVRSATVASALRMVMQAAA